MFLTPPSPPTILQVGCLVGALSSNFFGDRFGRKLSVMGYSVVFIVGGALQAIGINIGMLYAGRFFAGFGIGKKKTSNRDIFHIKKLCS
jgi:MFS family permease